LVFMVLLTAAGCGGSGSSSNEMHPLAEKQWDHFTEQRMWEALNPDFCAGGFGMMIDHQGNVTDGPSLDGKVIHNKLTADELNSLNSALNAYIATVTGTLQCSAVTIPGVGEQLIITFSDQTTHGVFTFRPTSTGGEVCIAGDRNALERLEAVVNQLLGKYYPVPFSSN